MISNILFGVYILKTSEKEKIQGKMYKMWTYIQLIIRRL